MFPLESKECTFTISKCKYTFTNEIYNYQTFFDVKILFAEEFSTIAQIITIKKNSQFLSDEQRALDNSVIFEVDVIEG